MKTELTLLMHHSQDSFFFCAINTTEIEPDFADNFEFPLGKAVPKEMTYGMSNTFGFGGHIASVLFKKFEE